MRTGTGHAIVTSVPPGYESKKGSAQSSGTMTE